MAHVEYFDRRIISLQRELAQPEHKKLAAKYIGSDYTFDELIGRLAAEVDIAMDGMYLPKDLINLCPLIELRLAKRRQGSNLIIIGSGDI